MINTGGYPVSVMPQFQPADPSLLAFNPQQVAQGALSSLGVVNSLEQIKALRQHTEEIAKMSNARNKLLKSQADLAEIQSGEAAATTQSKARAQNAQNDALSALFPKRAQVEGGELDIKQSLLPGQGKLALIGQNSALDIAPLQAVTDLSKAKGAETMSIADNDYAVLSQKIDLAQKNLDLATKESDFANKDFDAGKIRKIDADNAKTKLELAKADFDTAQAELARQKPSMAAQAIAAKNAAKTQLREDYKVASTESMRATQELFRLATTPVPNPNKKGQAINLSEITREAYDISPKGDLIPKTSFFKKIVVDPATLQALEQYKQQFNQLNDAHTNQRLIANELFHPQKESKPVVKFEAIKYLKDHPNTAPDFDEIFGAGEADKILGR